MSDNLNQLLKEIRAVNLCTWYLLPITGINRFSFGEGLFVNSYLERNQLWIIVQVPDLHLVPNQLQAIAIRSWQNDRGGFLAYELAHYWAPDIQKYIEGKYSKFSATLKAVIFDRSGLSYRQPDETGKFTTDIRLMAVDGKRELKQYLMEELDIDEGSLPDDLLPAPGPSSFMDVQEG